MILIEFLIALVIGFVTDLFTAGIVWLIFGIIGIPFLHELSYWQVFGLCAVVSIMTAKIDTSD